MRYDALFNAWCNLSPGANILVLADRGQMALAQTIAREIGDNCTVCPFENEPVWRREMNALAPEDLLLAALSLQAYLDGANRIFSPFGKPDGLRAKFAFLRLDISDETLREGLSTPKELVYAKIAEMNRFKDGDALRVTGGGGTDLTLKIKPFTTCAHEITAPGGCAFLPPSETSAEALPHTANGVIAADVTVGQLYFFGELLGEFGRVPSPVFLRVEDGLVTDIYGNAMADALKEKLFALKTECRELVELGQGLSRMTPTGLIGVDESILATCHFGIGDGGRCGVHLDVVFSNPMLTEAEENA